MISPTAEYALRAIVALAQADGGTLVTAQMAEITRVPPGYLSKVLQVLRRGGLVRSKRGLGGGFTLSRPADKITVLEVVNAVDPVERITKCPLGISAHGAKLCALHAKLDAAIASVERSFAETTVAALLAENGKQTPFCDSCDAASAADRVIPDGPAS